MVGGELDPPSSDGGIVSRTAAVSTKNSVSVSESASDAVIIAGHGNVTNVTNVTVYLAAGVTRSIKIPEPADLGASLGPNPYRGLAAFFEEDAERFFGRDKQIARLWEAFRSLHQGGVGAAPPRILPILGPSEPAS
jgi:hypothetical protein